MADLYREWQPLWRNPIAAMAFVVLAAASTLAAVAAAREDGDGLRWLPVVLPVLLLGWLAQVGLETRVTQQGLVVRYRGLRTRRIAWGDLVLAEAIEVSPLGHYGGWGIRYGGRRRGWVYNVWGRQVVRTIDGRGRILAVGTHDPEGLMEAIRSVWTAPSSGMPPSPPRG